MVLSTDIDLVGSSSESRMLHASATSAVDAEAKRRALAQMPVPIPATVVRTYLSEFEEDSLRRLLTRFAGDDVVDGWSKGPESNGIQVLHGAVEGSSWHTMCTTGKVRVTADKAARLLVSAEMVPKFDDMTKEVRVVEKLSDATEVRVVSCKSVMFTSARDFVVATTVRREADGRILIATRSVDHPAGKRAGYTRALSYISGYVVTPDPVDPNACVVSVIAHMDLGGNMPAMVINYLGLSAPIKLVEKIRDVAVKAKI